MSMGKKQPPIPAPDEDSSFDFPEHRLAVAGQSPPPQTRAVSSVWQLATTPTAPRTRCGLGRFGVVEAEPLRLCRVEREGDRVRVERLRPEETKEWAEREQARRAKQTPPPPRWKKSRGERLRRLIDSGLAEW